MWFLKARARTVKLRDSESGVMRDVGPREWVLFGGLPRGMDPERDSDVEVRRPLTQEDLDAIEADNRRMAGGAVRPPVLRLEPTPQPEPVRRGRRKG